MNSLAADYDIVNAFEGYQHIDWPDLSCLRSPTTCAYTSSSQPLAGVDLSNSSYSVDSTIIAALGRLVGAICGVSDILLAFSHVKDTFVPLRVKWSAGQTWAQVISQIDDACTHGRSSDSTTLMQTMRTAFDLSAAQNPFLALYSTIPSEERFPLSITFDRTQCTFTISSTLSKLHPSFASLILSQLISLAAHGFHHPEEKMEIIPMLSPELMSFTERRANPQSQHAELVDCVMEYLQQQAEASPGCTAVQWHPTIPQNNASCEYQFDSMTYTEWNTAANRLARWLLSTGLKSEDRVAVCMNRNLMFHIVLIGILKAGGCYVPIDPDLPEERKRYIVSDSGSVVIFASSEAVAAFRSSNVPIYEEVAIQRDIQAYGAENLLAPASDSLAYLLYTSGTTGNPKGCLLTHQGLSQAIWALSEKAADCRIEDLKRGRYLALASIAFDVHLAETLVPIVLGMPLISAPRSLLLENLPLCIKTLNISHIGLVPSLIDATMNAFQDESKDEEISLRYIASGGEKLNDSILDDWADHPRVRLANYYGPSEVTIGCCARYMDRSTRKENVGRMFDNVSGYVVDENLNILPRGGVGELIVEGPLVGRGYHERPDLTKKVFLEWPNKGCKAYRTGDLVRMLPDSTLEIVGRIDTQIKLRGVRIESEGISAIVRSAISHCPGFSLDAITVLAKHPGIGSDQIVTFIAWDPIVTVSRRKTLKPCITVPPSRLLRDIRKKCNEELATYMHPSHIIPLSWLPLTSNGKADARALVRLFMELDLGVLAGLMVDVDRDDNNLQPSQSHLTDRHSHTANFTVKWMQEINSSYPPEKIEKILPAYNCQEGILSRSAESTSLYVQHVVLRLKDHTILPTFNSAWQKIVSRHPILRTVFHFSRDLIQVILRQNAIPSSWTEKVVGFAAAPDFLKWFSVTEASAISRDLNEDISTVPPVRCGAYTSSNAAFIVISIHHALFDGTTLPLLLQDLEKACLGAPLLPSPEPSWILDIIYESSLANAKQFWTTKFHGYQWGHSPFSSTSSSDGQIMVVPFSVSLSSLQSRTARAKVTLQALFTCAFAKLISTRIYHTKDVVFGVIRAGRLLPVDGIDVAVCPLVSVLPARVDFGSEDVLYRIQKDIYDTIEFEHVPLKRIQSWLRPGLPLFDTLFSVSMKQISKSQLWEFIDSKPPEPDYPLAVEVVLDPDNDTLAIQAAWLDGKVQAEVVHTLLHAFEDVSSNCLNEDNLKISLSGSENSTQNTIVETPQSRDNLIDEDLVNRIRVSIADFLQIDAGLINNDTSLISLGLDSIKSVGLSRLLRKQNVIDVSAQMLITNSTVTGLVNAAVLQVPVAVPLPTGCLSSLPIAEVDALKLSPEDIITTYRATALQAGMLSQTISSGGKLYIHAFPLRLADDVNVLRLRGAWERTVSLVSILRTSFHFGAEKGIWLQVIHSSVQLDWSADGFLDQADYELKLANYVASVTLKEESDFRKPPFSIRVYLPSMKEDSARLVLVMHHALYDGVSVAKLLNMVQSVYDNREEVPMTQFSDVLPNMIYQEDAGTGFWLDKLHGYCRIPLPKIAPVVGPPIHSVQRTVLVDSSLLSNVLMESATTTQCLWQAALAKVLARTTGSSDIVFGHIVSGRSLPGAEDVIGPVMNTVPCRVRLSNDITNIDLLRNIQQFNVDVLPWQQASLRSVQKELGMGRLWDALFSFQPLRHDVSGPKGFWTFDSLDEEAMVQYPLNVELHQNLDGFLIRIAGLNEFFDAENLSFIMNALEDSISEILEGPWKAAMSHQDIPFMNPQWSQESLKNCSSSNISDRRIPDPIKTILANLTKIPLRHITGDTPLAALGVDSITAIQVAAHCRKQSISLSASDVAKSRTVADLADRANEIKIHVNPSAVTQVDITVRGEEAETIYRQFTDARLESITIASTSIKWLVGGWLRSCGARYQHAFAFRLSGDIDVARLRGAWIALIERHAILRSTFWHAGPGAEPRLVTFKPSAIGTVWYEEELHDRTFFRTALSRMKLMVDHPPGEGELQTQAVLLQSSEHKYLLVHLHHFQYDAWSLTLLMDDLRRLYNGQEPVSSNDLHGYLAAYAPRPDHLSEQEKYWRSVFPADFKPVLFPQLCSAQRASRLRSQRRRTIYTDTHALNHASWYDKRARALDVSFQSVILACWAKLQSQYAPAPDNSATFGVWHSGRGGAMEDLESLAVPCINILPLYVSGLNLWSVEEVARRVQKDLVCRSALVEQTEMGRIEQWVANVGGVKQRVCNVLLNFVKTGLEDLHDGMLEPVHTSGYCPEGREDPRYGVVQDDVVIDVAIMNRQDTIMISVDAAPYIMDVDQAKILVQRLVILVKGTLGLP